MGYQTQLVVRTRDPREGQLIERIKELAGEKGKTYSEMALELLARGLGDVGAASSDPTATVDADSAGAASRQSRTGSANTAAPAANAAAAQEKVTAAVPGPTTPAEPTRVIPQPEEPEEPEFDLDVDYDTSVDYDGEDGPAEVADKAVTCFDEAGVPAAVQLLARFFSDAGPVEGGQVRNALKDRLNRSDFDAIQDALNEAPPYRQYRKRVIYGH